MVNRHEILSAPRPARLPSPGQLVDVGGYRLYLHVTGDEQGLPVVILEHGGMGMSAHTHQVKWFPPRQPSPQPPSP